MIKSFKDADTELLWETGKSRRVPASIRIAALKKLAILHWATHLTDLKVPSRQSSGGTDRRPQGPVQYSHQ